MNEVFDVWFAGGATENVKKKWFLAAGTPEQAAFDQLVSERFGKLLDAALTGAYDEFAKQDARSALAAVVLLDQLSRHIFRKEPQRLIPCDEKAAAIARHALAVQRASARNSRFHLF